MLKDKRTELKTVKKELSKLEAKKAAINQKTAEEAKKAETESVVKCELPEKVPCELPKKSPPKQILGLMRNKKY